MPISPRPFALSPCSISFLCLSSRVSPVSERKFMPRGKRGRERERGSARGPMRLSRPIPIPRGRVRRQTTGAGGGRAVGLPSPSLSLFPGVVSSAIHCSPTLTPLYLGSHSTRSGTNGPSFAISTDATADLGSSYLRQNCRPRVI